MPRPLKFVLEHVDTWEDGTGRPVASFYVCDLHETWTRWRDEEKVVSPRPIAMVWWDGETARCQKCSGALAGMLTTCAHARFVKRHAPREVPPNPEPLTP